MGTEVATFSPEFWANRAKEQAAQEPPGFNARLTARSGMLMFDGEPLPENKALAIVVDTLREHDYYDPRVAYDPENPVPPICYALARDAETLGPFPKMQDNEDYFQPQSMLCSRCHWSEWNTAVRRDGTKSKGKACQQRRRLYMIAAGRWVDNKWKLFTDPGYYEQADIVSLKLPVTSVEHWSNYVSKRLPSIGRSYDSVATVIRVQPHVKNQFEILYEAYGNLPDDIAAVVLKRQAIFREQPIEGYAAPKAEAPF